MNNLNNLKLAIFESERNGEITITERTKMLSILDDYFTEGANMDLLKIYTNELQQTKDELINLINERTGYSEEDDVYTEFFDILKKKKNIETDFIETGVKFQNVDIQVPKDLDGTHFDYIPYLKKDVSFLSKSYKEVYKKVLKIIDSSESESCELDSIIYDVGVDSSKRRFSLEFMVGKNLLVPAYVMIENNSYKIIMCEPTYFDK